MTTWFTSDTHFCHANIITYCNRPFSGIEEMTEKLVVNWNTRVMPDDLVYHLGDFSMGNKDNVHIRKRLNGKIILIRGNHDFKIKKKDENEVFFKAAGFDEIYNNLKLEMDGLKLWLAHIPLHVPDPFGSERTVNSFPPELLEIPPIDYKYDYFLCGHVHDKWARRGNTINVGLDVSNFSPITLSELLKRDPCPTSEK